MKIADAKLRVCPFRDKNCLVNHCIAWAKHPRYPNDESGVCLLMAGGLR